MEPTTTPLQADLDAFADEFPSGRGEMIGTADGTWINDALGDGWIVSHRVVERDGELLVAEVRIHAAPHGHKESMWFEASLLGRPDGPAPAIPRGGLSTRRVRQAIRTAGAVDRVRAERRRDLDSDAFQGFQSQIQAKWGVRFPEFSREALATPRHVGRRGRSDLWYAQIAAVYVAAIENGRRDVNVAVAEHLGGGYDAAFARGAVGRARKRGLLTEPAKGRAGGHLTDKARKVLEGES